MNRSMLSFLALALCPVLAYGVAVDLTLLDQNNSADAEFNINTLDNVVVQVLWDSYVDVDYIQFNLRMVGPADQGNPAAENLWNVVVRTQEPYVIEDPAGIPVETNEGLGIMGLMRRFGENYVVYNPVKNLADALPPNTPPIGGMDSWSELAQHLFVPAQTGRRLITYELNTADLSALEIGQVYTLTLGSGPAPFRVMLGGTPLDVASSPMTITIVPEPSTTLLLLMTLPIMFLGARRK